MRRPCSARRWLDGKYLGRPLALSEPVVRFTRTAARVPEPAACDQAMVKRGGKGSDSGSACPTRMHAIPLPAGNHLRLRFRLRP